MTVRTSHDRWLEAVVGGQSRCGMSELVASGATGNTVPDAFHAALAIESGSTWVTHDHGFARFPGLRWQTPG